MAQGIHKGCLIGENRIIFFEFAFKFIGIRNEIGFHRALRAPLKIAIRQALDKFNSQETYDGESEKGRI